MYRKEKCRQGGVSMVELMIGMLLGVILTGGAISIYLASKRSYTESEQYAALAENTQFARRVLGDALRHVGFFGEVQINRIQLDTGLSAVVSDCSGAAAAYDFQNYLFAATADGDGNALGCITDAVPGSDVLVVKSVQPTPMSDGPRDAPDPDVETHGDGVIDTPEALRADQTYVMTNDSVGIMFDGADTPPSILTGGDIPGGVAWAYSYEVYYVRDGAIPQLARKTLAMQGGAMTVVTEDMIEGAEAMRLRFGLDLVGGSDGEVDTYRSVAAVGSNWGEVESVEIYLLIRSATEDPNYTDDKTYRLGGTDVTPNDNHRRMLLFNSVSLRNPKLVIRGDAT